MLDTQCDSFPLEGLEKKQISRVDQELVPHLITCISFSLTVLKIKFCTKCLKKNFKNVHFMPSETVLFFPNKIQELWSELKREFTAEQSCF